MYLGRFAPSPTGPLHQGSLLCALASYLDARANNGKWLLRIEDLDPPREVEGATDAILYALQQHGLFWDDDVSYQSRRLSLYDEAFASLRQLHPLFRCQCSKRQLREYPTYPGTCRLHAPDATVDCAWRVAVPDIDLRFNDLIQGPQQTALASQVGDFIVKRKDGLHAYQLAVVVDDASQGISHIVRGYDLLDSTAMQLHLQTLLKLKRLHYAHIPIVVNELGEKLSKQRLSEAVDNNTADTNLRNALQQLQQVAPPPEISTPTLILQWASQHWDPKQLHDIQHVRAI